MSIFKSSLRFSFGTIISRVSGLARESVVAGVFGASPFLDAFLVANRIPNMLRELAAEGAIGSSFTKVFSKVKAEDEGNAKEIFLSSLWFFGLCILLITLLGMIGSEPLTKIFNLAFHKGRGFNYIEVTSNLTRLIFPFIIFMTLGAIFSGVLHERGQFFLSSCSSIALNFGYILGALVFPSLVLYFFLEDDLKPFGDFKIFALSLGVLLGGFLQVLVQLLGVLYSRYVSLRELFKPRLWDNRLKEIIFLMVPMIVASGSSQINILVNTNFATSLQPGAVSWLSYSFRLIQLPIGVFAVAIATVILPVLSKISKENFTLIGEKFCESFLFGLWLLLPCSVFCFINAKSIITFLFFHGAFLSFDVEQTAQAMSCYSLGIIGYGLTKILTSYYYAFDKTKHAMYMSLVTIFINFFGNWFFMEELGVKGLALTASLVMSLNGFMLFFGMKKFTFRVFEKSRIKELVVIFLAGLLSLIIQGFFNKILFFSLENSLHQGVWSVKRDSLLLLFINACVLVVVFGGFYKIFKKNTLLNKGS